MITTNILNMFTVPWCNSEMSQNAMYESVYTLSANTNNTNEFDNNNKIITAQL